MSADQSASTPITPDTISISTEESRQRSYYDSIAQLYDSHYANRHALAYRYSVYDLGLRGLGFAGKSALDAMCGGGEGTGYLLRRGARVTGLDISPKCCEVYAQRHPGVPVVCSSVIKTDFPDSTFDFILTDSLHHLPPRLDEGVAEIHRILKPGGYFCCWEPSADSLVNILRKAWYRLDPRFFQENEQAIHLPSLMKSQAGRFELVHAIYGGNLAYLLVNCSMAFRIPTRIVNIYAPTMMFLERLLGRFQSSALSLWVLCLMRKKASQDRTCC
ncbi:MAG: class I SAM-dependent methyltransferase [Planctomycetes bacterium]|nr:class I SAM-dependent methyltransferase [Planctomycetota bacterium]